jgi:hypothetical protein
LITIAATSKEFIVSLLAATVINTFAYELSTGQVKVEKNVAG